MSRDRSGGYGSDPGARGRSRWQSGGAGRVRPWTCAGVQTRAGSGARRQNGVGGAALGRIRSLVFHVEHGLSRRAVRPDGRGRNELGWAPARLDRLRSPARRGGSSAGGRSSSRDASPRARTSRPTDRPSGFTWNTGTDVDAALDAANPRWVAEVRPQARRSAGRLLAACARVRRREGSSVLPARTDAHSAAEVSRSGPRVPDTTCEAPEFWPSAWVPGPGGAQTGVRPGPGGSRCPVGPRSRRATRGPRSRRARGRRAARR